MNIGKTLFAQLMDFLPWSTFARIVARYGGDARVRTLCCAEQYRAMAFAQLTYRESLRDIEVCLSARASKLYHIGFREPVRRSTLADANETRDWRIYAEFAHRLIAQARKLYASESLGMELANTVYALDSTTIDLCLSLFPWAHFRSTKAAVKMHTLLDLRGNIPSFVHISNGKLHDVHALDLLLPEAGAIYVMDRGYVDFARLYVLHQAGAFFVTRAKSNLDAHRVYSAPTDRATGIIADQTLPIRLLPTPPTCRVLPGSGVKLCVGRCGDVARDAEQGTEGVERIEPPVETEGEFVEVGLQVLVTDPVMDAVQPRFQVGEDEMDDWQILLGDLRIAPFSDGEVFVAALGEAGVAAPVVGDERRARHNGALDEAAERLRAAVRHDGEPNPPGIATTLPLVELGARLALANLHSAGDKNLIVDATAFAARPAANPGFIDFDVLAGPAADPVLIRAHHPRAELVEDLERRLVARQAKLSPKLHGRHAGCLAGHQIGRPKPYAQRRVRARHDRSHRQSGVTAALAAAQDAKTICEAERLSRRLTMRANEPVAPASLLQVAGTGRIVREKSLELGERLWEPKIAR